MVEVGNRFGKLKVIELHHTNKGVNVWLCQCDCGSSPFQVNEVFLLSGKTQSCACEYWKKFDLTGQRFGRLLVLEKTDKRIKRGIVYKCLCDCGNIYYAISSKLKRGGVKSCGCLFKEKQHFACKQPIHRVWTDINTRCYNKNRNQYYLYGGRGIKVCDEWLGSNPKGFSSFYDWAMSNGYKEEYLENGRNKWTLDRIDCDKDYSPENCRWITNKEQQSNKRVDKLFKYNGECKTIKEWFKIYNVKIPEYYTMSNKGMSNLDILEYISKTSLQFTLGE